MLKLLLYPLSIIYGVVTSLRNFLYDSKIFKTHNFQIPIISVGNITVGGTGKTPHAEYVISLLRKEFSIAFLSRGYKRKTKGYVLSTTESTLFDIGDEPVQIKQKFPEVNVAVCEKREKGIQKLIDNHDLNIDAIVLDDAFQHRSVEPSINILLLDYTQPVFDDQLLPVGKLRESLGAFHRANFIIITKCPDHLQPIEQRIYKNKLDIRPYQNLFFTSIRYGEITPAVKGISLFSDDLHNYTVLLITGIGNPAPLVEHIEKQVGKVTHRQYPDHYAFKEKDAEDIMKVFDEIEASQKLIITTEKDLVRLRSIKNPPPDFFRYVYYIPIEVKFLERSKEMFNKKILTHVRENKSNSKFYKR
jgi:tetraacyldisaccharide 4'-kinase